jgi:hypothetical protein
LSEVDDVLRFKVMEQIEADCNADLRPAAKIVYEHVVMLDRLNDAQGAVVFCATLVLPLVLMGTGAVVQPASPEGIPLVARLAFGLLIGATAVIAYKASGAIWFQGRAMRIAENLRRSVSDRATRQRAIDFIHGISERDRVSLDQLAN